ILSIKLENYSERSVKRDLTVLYLWRIFVTVADNIIFYRKKQIVTDYNFNLWTLTYINGKTRRGSGPINDIINEQTFVKIAAISTNIIVFLTTFWTKAKYIFCKRQNRIDLHKIILLIFLGGFRPGIIIKLKYKQIKINLVRNL
ncbi:hypothetical protein PoMZ_08658, partial [Pyricularia oryzae]